MWRIPLFCFRWWLPILLMAAGISLLAGLTAGRLQLDLSSESLIPAGAAAPSDGDLSSVYVEDPALFSPEGAARLWALHEALSGLPFVKRVDSLFTLADLRDRDGAMEMAPVLSWPCPD